MRCRARSRHRPALCRRRHRDPRVLLRRLLQRLRPVRRGRLPLPAPLRVRPAARPRRASPPQALRALPFRGPARRLRVLPARPSRPAPFPVRPALPARPVPVRRARRCRVRPLVLPPARVLRCPVLLRELRQALRARRFRGRLPELSVLRCLVLQRVLPARRCLVLLPAHVLRRPVLTPAHRYRVLHPLPEPLRVPRGRQRWAPVLRCPARARRVPPVFLRLRVPSRPPPALAPRLLPLPLPRPLPARRPSQRFPPPRPAAFPPPAARFRPYRLCGPRPHLHPHPQP